MKKRFEHICINYRYHLILLLALTILLNTMILSGCVIGAKEPEEGVPDTPKYNTIELSNDIIDEANEYLRTRQQEYYLRDSKFCEQLNRLKSGEKLLHVKFDPNNYYFVCAYYETALGQKVDRSFDDPAKYIWVGFANETEIPQYYEEAECVAVVQVNKTEYCRDIVSNSNAIPNIEHLMGINPVFKDGYNTNSPRVVEDMFVYVNNSDKDNVYYYSRPEHQRSTIYCIELDGEFYVANRAFSETGELDTEYLIYDFGSYYDLNVMITDKYDAENCPYGLLKFDDIAKILNE